MSHYTIYGWKLSYFTGKLISYFRYKNIPFVENNVNVVTLYRRVKEKTGAVLMPALTTPNGKWLQDTRNIIDYMEKEIPDRVSVFPSTPKRLFAASLLEAWGDEWWIPIAMHYRWSYPESVAQFKLEAGDSLLPHTPRFMKNHLAEKTAGTLISYLPVVGVVPEQYGMIEAWTRNMLERLNAHFEKNRFLLGNRCASIGDFGLMGPLWAHLSRDPWPRDHLMGDFPHVLSWIERMQCPHTDYENITDEDTEDVIPETLTPILELIFKEFTPMNEGILCQLNATLADWPVDMLLKRTLSHEQILFPMGENLFRRRCNPHTLFKTQGVLDIYHNADTDTQKILEEWVKSLGGYSFLQLSIPRLDRVVLQVKVVSNTSAVTK